MSAKFTTNNTNNIAPKPIIMLGHKLFIVDYNELFIHATDGLNTENGVSVLIFILFGNQFMLKTFTPKENYSKILGAMLELQ